MTATLYGIPNCSTVKKARAWLDERQVPYTFINFKTTAPEAGQLARWLDAVGADTLVNRRGTTWRKLDPAVQAAAGSREGAIALMQAQPSVIKRPVLEYQGRIHVGFSPELYSEIFA
ncbi:arsenate reductase [Eikenella sp. S3360]|uniref:Arsenate reductase n=1 Tax=Eikenella glucosivorans TaxID=2766967 RepID=A0ABS0N9F9_9NEIS|nr:arsenate reductase [Eikenella glucosivorans]MBH5328933.1 arsenate reductase [Eikenella glucosivorans]